MLDSAVWKVRGHHIPLRDPVVMGIVNVTPDSFSDGGVHLDPADAIASARRMVAAGAAIVDVGGESTRPNAAPVTASDEMARVLPVVEQLASEGIVVSVDTSKPDVAEAAIDAGAAIINDVTGLRSPGMLEVCGASHVGVVIMHMQGEPRTMQDDPTYGDVVREVRSFLAGRALAAVEAGVPLEGIAIDPGIGFGKTLAHNIELLRNVDAFAHLGYPVLMGTSRKRFLGTILEPFRGATEPVDRDGATAATIAAAILGGASIVRVHNVPLGVEVAMTAKAIVRNGSHDEEAHRT